MLRKLIAMLLGTALLFSWAAAEEPVSTSSAEGTEEVTVSLPIDFTPGSEPLESGYSKDGLSYTDPTITVTLTTGREASCDWWIADIKIADASQLRTRAANSFSDSGARKGVRIAEDAKAVLAINGDYFCYTGEGLIIREGITYKDKLQKDRDVLTIDANGDFHVYFLPDQGEVPSTVDGVPVINAFYFGPVLVYEGKVTENVILNSVVDKVMAGNELKQRMALCQVGPLEYKCICCAGPTHGNKGMTLQQFAEFVGRQGVQTAYNLDGGDSTMLIFHYTKQNNIRSTTTRKLVDIVYFASAWDKGGN